MKKFFIQYLVLIVSATFLVAAINPTPTPPKKKKEVKEKGVNKLLKEVSKKYKGYTTLKADFTRLNQPADAKAASKTDKGSIITKGNNYKFTFMGQEIYCNGKYIWTYTIGGDCTKEKYKPNKGHGLDPTKLFSIWEKGFLYISDGTYKKGTTEIQKVKLTPTDKTRPYFLMNLEVVSATKLLNSLKVSFKDGHKETYTITSQTPNTAIDDSTFEFDPAKHPGVEVIDLTN